MKSKHPDEKLLDDVLALPDLPPREREAFEGMKRDLPRFGALTLRQRDWVQRAGARLGLQIAVPAEPPPRVSAWDPAPRPTRKRRSF